VFIAWTAFAHARTDMSQFDEPPHAVLLQIVSSEIANGRIPGAVILAGTADGASSQLVHGNRMVRPRIEPMTADTVFDLASLTKVVATTTAVMQLVERGKLDLAAPVARYWPEFGAHGKAQITVQQLLTHTSGLPAEPPGLGETSHRVKPAALLRNIASIRPAAAPDERTLYSDVNFVILGVLVARVSGMPFDTYCRKFIFAPLGMTDTGFAVPPESAGRLADQFDNTGGAVLEAATASDFRVPPPFPSGAGGLVSTAADLHRFGRMLLGRAGPDDARVLSANSRRAMMVDRLTEQHRASGALFLEGDGWGYCGSVGRGGPEPWQRAGRFGWVGGTGTALHVLPDADTVTILLTQQMMSGPSTTDLMHRFWTYAGRS
jgi:CubicO group peptidase (beta-lactamase class C family)